MIDRRESLMVACVLGLLSTIAGAPQLRPVAMDTEPNLFVWTDTCNVYVLRDGDAALLIDLGDASVLDHLAEFGGCIQGEIDGKHIAFTGDNLFGASWDPAQNGHEAVVARNSDIFEEGYIYGADYLQKLQPDIIVAGHSYVIDHPKGMIDRFVAWAREIRDTYQTLSAEGDYRYIFDPYWVRAEPYRVSIQPGQVASVGRIG